MRLFILSATLALTCAFPVFAQRQDQANDLFPVRNNAAQPGG